MKLINSSTSYDSQFSLEQLRQTTLTNSGELELLL